MGISKLQIQQTLRELNNFRFSEYKIRSLEIVNGVQYVEFYACTYNNQYPIFMDTDKIKEMILPGAFDEWLRDPEGFDRVVHLLDHDETCGIVEKIWSDNIGLIVRSALLSKQNNESGDVALSHYETAQKVGKKVKHSIGFIPFDRESESDYYFDENLNCLILKRAKLFDVSTVTKWAANVKAVDLAQRIAEFTQGKEKKEPKNLEFLKNVNINF